MHKSGRDTIYVYISIYTFFFFKLIIIVDDLRVKVDALENKFP